MLRIAVSGGGYRAAVVVSCRQSALRVVSNSHRQSTLSLRGESANSGRVEYSSSVCCYSRYVKSLVVGLS